MKLYEKIKNMTLEEMAGEIMLISTLDEKDIREASTGEDGLFGFIVKILEQEVIQDDEFNVYDVKVSEDGHGCESSINFLYECGELGDCEYTLSISDTKYDEATDSFKRSIYAFSNEMDTETDKTTLYRILNAIADQAIVVD